MVFYLCTKFINYHTMTKNSNTNSIKVKLVRKANELVEARYKFDIWETRVFAKMLTMLKPDDKDFQTYHIHVGELLKDFNLQGAGDNYIAVKQATKKLLSRVIEIQKETPEGLMWYAMPLLIGAKGFVEARGDNFISVQFHQELKPYLLELKERYLQYDIRNLWGLSSVYSVRMYELLKQYEKIGKRFFELDDLKEKLAIQPTEYEKYNHFKEKVILKAQGDLGNCTDIAFSIEERKQGRKVSGITFFIYSNPTKRSKKELSAIIPMVDYGIGKEMTDNSVFMELYDQVHSWGVSEETLKNLITEKGMEKVKNGIICTNESLKEGKVKTNTGGFFIKAVEEGWINGNQVKQGQKELLQNQKAEQKAKNIEELAQLEEKLSAIQEVRQTEANKIISGLTQADPFLAGEAVNKILNSKLVKYSLEKQTGLVLSNLDMSGWRSNKPLREAVIRQIELMHEEEFKDIHVRFDGQIRQLKARVEELQTAIKK